MAQDFDDIELNIAAARDNLAATLDEIADRVDPSNVMEKGKAAAKDALQKVEVQIALGVAAAVACLLYTSPSPRDRTRSRMPSSA